MQNDELFEAEANVEALERATLLSRHTDNNGDAGALAVASARGGIYSQDSSLDEESEDAPLIPPEQSAKSKPDFEGLPWWKTPSIYWLLPPFLLFTLSFGGTMVPKLNLILTLICQGYFTDRSINDPTFYFMPVVLGNDNPQCRIPEVQALVARFTLWFGLISGLLCCITSPKLGALSDLYGRNMIIIITTLGMLVGEGITIAVATFPDTLSVYWLMLGGVVDGLCGSFIAALAVAHAYATDCTQPAKRNVAFAYFHGCLFSGIALGPILAGYIIKATGQILTIFYIAVGAHGAFILSLLFVVPESLAKERQMANREKNSVKKPKDGRSLWLSLSDGWAGLSEGFNPLVPLQALIAPVKGTFQPLGILYPTEEGSNRAVRMNLVLLSAVDTILFGVAMGSMTVVVIYSNYMFGWGNFESSRFVSIVNVCRVFMLIVALPIITRLVRGKPGSKPQRNSGCDGLDLAVIRTAIFFDMLGYIGYAVVRTGSLMTLSGAIAAVGGMGSPTLQAALTKHVPPDRTGQLLGAVGLLHALARVVAPVIFNSIYAATVGNFTQTVFVCLASTFGVAFFLSWFLRPHVYLDEPKPEEEHSEAGLTSTANDDGIVR
ncbi:MAG: hypothetical protein M1812_003401 [Candelaria pacifica]|nr:MAG: hypothetical protein M1812_003401 [Candelaria pacifica]